MTTTRSDRAAEIEKAAKRIIAAFDADPKPITPALQALRAALALPAPDTFPRAPVGEDETDAAEAYVYPESWCDARHPRDGGMEWHCTRPRHAHGDHVAASSAALIRARWPQQIAPAPGKGERWGVAIRYTDGDDTIFWSSDAQERTYATAGAAAAEAGRLEARYADNVPPSTLRYFAHPRPDHLPPQPPYPSPTPAPQPEAKREEREVVGYRLWLSDGYCDDRGGCQSVPRDRAFLFRDGVSPLYDGESWARAHAKQLRKIYGAETVLRKVTRAKPGAAK